VFSDMAVKSSSTKNPATKATRKPATTRSYHHGNLRQALVDAAVELAHEGGIENVSVREAARRAGVSPGAPFRHFAGRRELLTAVAEEGMGRFIAAIEHALGKLENAPPLARFRALGTAFMHWSLHNPTHFRILSSREWIDYEGSPTLRQDNQRARVLTESILQQAHDQGAINNADIKLLALTMRAAVYGLARMHIDGQLPHWGITERLAENTCLAAMNLLVDTLERK